MRSPNALAEKPANNLRWIMFKNHVNPPSPNILTIGPGNGSIVLANRSDPGSEGLPVHA